MYDSGFGKGGAMLPLLAVGHKHGFAYLLHLFDDYQRDRAKHFGKKWEVSDWSHPNNHNHFRKLAHETVKVARKVAEDPEEARRKAKNSKLGDRIDLPMETIFEDKKYTDLV